jgi:hypothetical protein
MLAGENPSDVQGRLKVACEELGADINKTPFYVIGRRFNIHECAGILKEAIEKLPGASG